MSRRFVAALVAAVVLAALAAPATAAQDKKLEELERQVAELRAQVAALQGGADSARLEEIERRIDILSAEIEKLQIGEAAVAADTSRFGLGPAASKVYGLERGVSIGGYGELLFQGYDSELENGTPSDKKDQFDLLRAVFYFGYKFNDRWLFNSEIEYEHGTTGEDGEISVEFAYLDWLGGDKLNARVGLLLIPMGFINELHEPTTFLSSARPDTERYILPSTWRENGAGVFGDLGPVSYRAYIVNGLDASGFSSSGLRDGRQDGSKATAEDFAAVARFDYVGTLGLVAGASAYVGNSGQGIEGLGGQTLDVGTTIVEGHVDWRWRGLRLRALASRATLDDVAELNDALMLTGDDSIGDKMTGGYLEAGYDVLSRRGKASSLVPFVRWESLDTQDGVPVGFQRDPATEQTIVTYGVAWQPIPQLIFKLDYQDRSNEADTGLDQINAAVGYVF